MDLNAGLACRRLDFRWPGKHADEALVLKSVEAVFSPGTVSLVAGDTGSGKSTLLHLLAGLLRPTAGEVWADGLPVSRWPSRHRDPWRQQTGIVFQHLALIPDLTWRRTSFAHDPEADRLAPHAGGNTPAAG